MSQLGPEERCLKYSFARLQSMHFVFVLFVGALQRLTEASS